MGQLGRFMFALKVTVAAIVMTIVYFRGVIDHLKPIVADFQGPFTPAIDMLYWVVPLALSIIVAATWGWVLISPQQEEKARAVRAANPTAG